MKSINKIIVIGRITHDMSEKDFGYIGNGTARANISIAVNDSKKDQSGNWVDEVSYFDVVLWGKMAENLKPYLTKGQKIAVDGKLKQDRWQDQNGQNRSKIYIVAESVELCSNPNRQNEVPYNAPMQNVAPVQNNAPMQQGGFAEDYPAEWDNIPFNN